MTRSRRQRVANVALRVVLGLSASGCVGGQTGTPISELCKSDLDMLRADATHVASFGGSYVGRGTVHGSLRIPEGSVTTLHLRLTAFPAQVSPLPGSSCSSVGAVPARLAVHTEGENGLDVELRGQLTKRAAGAELTIEDDEADGTLLFFSDAPASLELEVGTEMFTASQLERE